METVRVSIDLPVFAHLSTVVRALEASRDAQNDPNAKQALAVVTALASRGLLETLAKPLKAPREKGVPPAA